MIAVDTNILVYAHRTDVPFHRKASETITTLAEGTKPWCFTWSTVHEFLSVVTNLKIFKTPTPLPAALAQVSAWMESPTLRVIGEDGDAYWQSFQALVVRANVTGAKIHDARIASTVLQHGCELLYSADRDFSRFVSLKIKNPLIEK
jgi:uncharacterized protein